MTPTKSDSERLARANLGNIAKKLSAGKTLTTAERKAVTEFQLEEAGGWIKDTSALAKELGLSRQTIYDARAKFPDAPSKHEDGKRENLTAWQAFVGEHLIGKDHATKNLAELKAELMREQIKLARMKNDREAGDTVEKRVVEDMLTILGQKLNLLLQLKLEVEMGARVAGKSPAEANVEGGLMLDEIREVINSNIANFQREALVEQRIDL